MSDNTAKEKAEQIFELYFKNKNQIKSMLDTKTLFANKSMLFVLNHVINKTINDIDFELYSPEVNYYYQIYLLKLEQHKPIHGDFYNDLRQRYFDLLNCEPFENSKNPLSNNHLAWMLSKLSDEDMSETKKHRWLGFIQGCMTFLGFIKVDSEREITRNIFNGN